MEVLLSKRIFRELIQAKWSEGKSVCVGLDSDPEKISGLVKWGKAKGVVRFNSEIVDATRDLVCAYKPNVAFYAGLGANGISALIKTVKYINKTAPDVPVIGDGKWGDIGNTNCGYAKFAFEVCGFDAVTLQPYLGEKSLEQFFKRPDKGLFILCRTSNEGSDEFQDLNVVVADRHVPLYQYVAHRVATDWNQNGNCGLVVGATYPDELAQVRAIVGDDMPILIPGIGEQGGDLQKTIEAGEKNMIINAGRSVIFASYGPDFAPAARKKTIKLQKEINRHMGEV